MQSPMAMGAYDPYFIQTEFEVIQSELILGRVVDRPESAGRWGKTYGNGEKLSRQDAISVLKRKMALHPVRNTILIEIQVFSEKPAEAAEIANAIAKAYQEHRTSTRANLSKSGITSLLQQREAKETEIATQQAKVDKLRQDLKIPDSTASEYSSGPLLTQESLKHINALRLESEAEFVRQNTLLSHLKELSKEKLAQTLCTVVQENLLGNLLEQKTMADQRLIFIEKDLGTNHPDVIKALASKADLEEKISSRVEGDMLGLETKVASLGASLTNLTEEVTKATQEDIDKANTSQPVFRCQAPAGGAHQVPRHPRQQDRRREGGQGTAQEHHGDDYRQGPGVRHAGATRTSPSISPWASSSAWWSASGWPSSSSTSTPA